MQDGCIVAIDQGTTGTTVLVIDHAGSVLGQATSEFTQHYPQPGWVEHDAEEIWSVSRRVIEDALEQSGRGPEAIRALGITNQRETVVLWERKTGRPVAPAIVWQDRRTAALCDELKREGLEAAWQRKTGLLIDPYFSATKIRWLLDHTPGLRERSEAGDIAFGTIDSWLVWKLTGGACHVTDCSNASRTMLFNIGELVWDADILQRLDIPAAILPRVRPSSCHYGDTEPDAFGGHRVPVAGMAGDQQAALFGQACFGEGRVKNTYGTGSFLLMHTGTRPVFSRERLLTTIAWQVGEAPVKYALEGAVFVTGAAIQWLRDGLGLINSSDESEALAMAVEDNADVYFVPALAGLGAPYWDPYARGTIVGLTRGTTREHLVRATLESICYQTRDVVEAMRREAGIVLDAFRADGGAVANRFLMQFQADVLGLPVEVPVVSQTTALGAAYLAGLAVGFWESREELAAHWRSAARYEPRMAESERERLYARWREAVERSRRWANEPEPGGTTP